MAEYTSARQQRGQNLGRHQPRPRFCFPQQQVDSTRLHTTGGRPWTMYPRAPQRALSGSGSESNNACVTAAAPRKSRRGTQLTIVSYNVLADSLLSFDYIPYCRAWNKTAWKARPRRILNKILDFQPDVVCLQEVDESLYLGMFKPSLETMGYDGMYCQRSGDKLDGCATFVLGRRAVVASREDVVYKVEGHPVLDRDNVALLVVLEIPPRGNLAGADTWDDAGENPSEERCEIKMPPWEKPVKGETSGHPPDGSSPAASKSLPERRHTSGERAAASAEGRRGARLVVANTHLLFNPKRGDVKTAQLMMLTRSVERLAESSRADGVIICGDFNMSPDSALYHYMVKGQLTVDGLNRFDVSGQSGLTSNNYHHAQTRKIGVGGCGALPHRTAGVKHQGSGSALGSFDPTSGGGSGGGGGGRGRGEGRKRGRHGGRGEARQAKQLCGACSNRPPHAASSTYVAASASAPSPSTEGALATATDGANKKAAAGVGVDVDVDAPPGAALGALFAVMDPSSCRCKAEGADGDRVCHSKGARKTGGAAVRDRKGEKNNGESLSATAAYSSEDPSQGGREMDHLPPVLWPHTGASCATWRGLGPVAHRLRLRSAYAQQPDAWGTGEPAFTSYHHFFKGTVDYVFYGPGPLGKASDADHGGGDLRDGGALEPAMSGRLRCLGVAEPPMKYDLDRFEGLPSPEEPSDHILLAVRFEVSLS